MPRKTVANAGIFGDSNPYNVTDRDTAPIAPPAAALI